MFRAALIGYLPIKIAQGLVGLLTLWAFTRLLTPDQYGIYALVLSVMMLGHTATLTWVEAATARFQIPSVRDGATSDHLKTVYLLWLVIAGVVLPTVALIILPFSLAAEVKMAAICAAIAATVRSFAQLVEERLRADGEVSSVTILEVSLTVGGFILGLAAILTGAGSSGPFIGVILATLFSLAPRLKSELALSRGGAFERRRAAKYAGYGIPIAGSLLLAIVVTSSDRMFLAAFMTTADVGAYHAGYSLASRTLDVFFIWFGMASGPVLVRALEIGGTESLQEAAREQASFMLFLAVPAAVGLCLVAGPLADLMIGGALAAQSASIMPPIALGALLSGMTTYYLSQAFTLGVNTRGLLLTMAIPALVNAALNVALIPRFGISGSAWASVAGFFAGAVATYVIGRRVIPLPLPLGPFARALLASAVMVGVASVVNPEAPFVALALKSVLGALAYFVTAALLGSSEARRAWSMVRLRVRGA